METALIRMRGNHGIYEVGQQYDVPVDIANQLTGLGIAELVEPAPNAEE